MLPMAANGKKVLHKQTGLLIGEKILHLIHEGFGARVVTVAVRFVYFFQLTQQIALPLGKPNWRLDDNVAHQIARRRLPYRPNAFATEAKHLTTLRLGRNLDLGFAFERRNIDLAALCRHRKTDRHFAM